MKRFLIYMICLMAGFITGCKKETEPMLNDPDARLIEALAMNQSQLVGAPNGWLATIYPKGGKGYSFFIKFSADGTVNMLSDFNASSATTIQESKYRLKALQKPTLIFDTYNYIHLPGDPDPTVNGGVKGKGLNSDFEFALTAIKGDTLRMEGIVNGNLLTMVKASAAEEADIKAGGIKKMMDATDSYNLVSKYSYLTFDGTKITAVINPAAKTILLNYVNDKNEGKALSSVFSFGLNGLSLNSPLSYGKYVIKEFLWDGSTKQYYVNTGTRVNVAVSPTPVLPLAPFFGPLKDFSQIEYNLATVTSGLSADFNNKLTAAKAALLALGGRILDKVSVKFNSDNSTMSLTYSYRNAAGSVLLSVMTYNVTKDANDIYSFTFRNTDGNGGTVGPPLTPITDYFSNNKFKADWVTGSGAIYGGLYTTTDNASFFYGALIK